VRINTEMVMIEKSVLVQMIMNCCEKSLSENLLLDVIPNEIGLLTEAGLMTELVVSTFVKSETRNDC